MDSVLISRNKAQVIGLEEKYNHAQTEKARAHLMREKHRMQNLTVLSILLLIIVVAIYQLQLRRKRLVLAQKNNELLTLKNKILSMQNSLLLKEDELQQLSIQIEEYRKNVYWDRQGKELEVLYQKNSRSWNRPTDRFRNNGNSYGHRHQSSLKCRNWLPRLSPIAENLR